MQVANYLLSTIFSLVKNKEVTFISRSRSIECVVREFPIFSDAEAEDYVLNGILALTTDDFSSTAMQWTLVCDVYGKNIDGKAWYIKFAVEKDENGADNLSEISFHPIEKDLKLQSGIVLKGSVL